jgi:hypothetical protein
MKNQILNLGKGLSKSQQKEINGGEPGGGGPHFAARCRTNAMGASTLVGSVPEGETTAQRGDEICSVYGTASLFMGWECISFCNS